MDNFIMSESILIPFFVLLFLVSYYANLYFSNKYDKFVKNFKEYISQIDNFSPSQYIVSTNFKSGIVFDEKNQSICLLKILEDEFSNRIFTYKDLVSVEFVENGSVINNTVRTSQIGNALVGGLLLGGIGTVIGGLSGEKKQSKIIDSIVIRIIVNDTKEPVFELNFTKNDVSIESKVKQIDYNETIKKARHWHSLIEVLIKRADTEDNEIVPNTIVKVSGSLIADEIKKLAELRNLGVLSDSEFQQQKEKLLN